MISLCMTVGLRFGFPFKVCVFRLFSILVFWLIQKSYIQFYLERFEKFYSLQGLTLIGQCVSYNCIKC